VRTLYFCHVISIFFFLLFFFSSPNLSGTEIGCLPYFYTSCGLSANLECILKCAARGSLEMQDPKNRQKCAIWAPSYNFVGRYLRNEGMYRQSEKNLLNSNTSCTCPDNTVNFGPLAAEICWRVWGTPVNFNTFHVLVALLHGTLVVGISKLCVVEQRAPPILGRAAITLGIGPHF